MGKRKIGPIKRMAKKQINKEIRKQERHERRVLDIEEKREIKNNVLKKMRTRAAIFGAVGVLGIGGLGLMFHNMGKDDVKGLNEGQTVETDIGNNQSAREKFASDLNVTIPEGMIDEVKTEVLHEVQELQTSDEVLNYVKEMYAEQYNENNNTEISAEDVKFYKTTFDKVFYEDENGILRYCTEKEYQEMGKKGVDGDLPVISATISNGENNIKEEVAQKQNGEIVNIYEKDEVVEQDKETTLTQLGDVVLAGINYSTAIEQEENSFQTKRNYQDKLVDAIAEYREQQNSEKENTNTANNQIQQEDEER